MLEAMGFHKNAAKSRRKKKLDDNSFGYMAGGVGAGIALNTAAVLPIIGDLQKVVEPTAEVEASVAAFKRRNKLNTPVYMGSKAKHIGGYDMLKDSPTYGAHARNAKNEATILHELGHAKNWKPVDGKSYTKALATIRGLSVMGGTPAGAINYALNSDSKYAPLFPAAYTAPTLLDEGVASARAVSHLVRRNGLRKGLKKGWTLLPAFLSYAAMPSAMGGAIYLDQKRRGIR